MSRWLEKGNFNAGEYLGRFVRSEVGRSRPGKTRRMAAQCNLALSSRLHKSRSRLPRRARGAPEGGSLGDRALPAEAGARGAPEGGSLGGRAQPCFATMILFTMLLSFAHGRSGL